VCVDDPLGDREAQSRSARAACPRLVRSIETLEDPRQVLGGNADTRVNHREMCIGVVRPEGNAHTAARLVVLDGIRHQVEHKIRQPVSITSQGDLVQARLDRDPFLRSKRGQEDDGVADDGC